MSGGRKTLVTTAILKSARAAQVAAEEHRKALPVQQPAPVPAACAPIYSSDSTHTSDACQGPVTVQRGGADASTNRVPKRKRAKSLQCPPERPLKRRALLGNTAMDCPGSGQSAIPAVLSKPESNRPATYSIGEYTLHSEFYELSGNCTIMIERMLFRLPWVLFVVNSPVLAEMLRPCQKGVTPFLYLEGDSVEDFAALCWALTSKPDEAKQQHDTNLEESLRLGRLFNMATNYKVPRYREWARTMLLSCSQDILASWPIDSTLEVLAVASTVKDAIPEAVVCKVLKTRAETQPKHALKIAETLGLRQLQGYIYYQEMLRMSGASGSPPELTTSNRGWRPTEMGVLLRGFWSISRYWDTLKKPPQLPGSAGKDHERVCVKKWKRMWRRGRALGMRGDRPWYSPLLALEGLVDSVEEGTAEHCGCHYASLAEEVRSTLLNALTDHFLGGPLEIPKVVVKSEDSSDQEINLLTPSKVPKTVESSDTPGNGDERGSADCSDNRGDENGDSSSDESGDGVDNSEDESGGSSSSSDDVDESDKSRDNSDDERDSSSSGGERGEDTDEDSSDD